MSRDFLSLLGKPLLRNKYVCCGVCLPVPIKHGCMHEWGGGGGEGGVRARDIARSFLHDRLSAYLHMN